MKTGWVKIFSGFALLVLGGLLLRPVTIMRPVFDSSGNPIVVDGKVATYPDHFKTTMANWDAWLSLVLGPIAIFAGMRNLWHKK